MTTSPGLFDPRDASAIVARLATLARNRPVPRTASDEPTDPVISWHDLLFDGDRLSDPGRLDQALLAAVAELDAGLGEHLNALPSRLRAQWLQRVLGIPPDTAEADVVPLAFTAVPGRTPVVLPVDSEVRAKDGAGRDRRYLTTEPLTVHGVTLSAVRAYRAVREGSGAIADHVESWSDREQAFAPFATVPGTGALAPHVCRFADPVLAVSGTGTQTTVTVRLEDADARLLAGAQWFHSTSAGPRPAVRTAPGSAPGSTVQLTLTEACVPDPASGEALPWLQVVLPPEAATLDPDALSVTFGDVGLTVRVTGLPADAAYAGDGKLDTGKEFQPFGPVPRRGDAFCVRSQEAFAKPLARLGIELGVPPDTADDDGDWVVHPQGIRVLLDRDSLKLAFPGSTTSLATVTWQHRVEGAWQPITTTGNRVESLPERNVTTALPAVGFSEESTQGGKTGRAIRAVLAGGDLGWSAFQTRLAEFAAKAVNKQPVTADELLAPEPPTLPVLRITYETARVRPERVTTTDGWSWRRWAPGIGEPLAPFRVPAPLAGGPTAADAATLDFGLVVPDSALGASVSLYLDVDSADVGAAAGSNAWQVATASGWQPATVSDGTRGLRQSGLLHLVAPLDWALGSADSGDPDGPTRWLRLTSTEPGRLGALLAVVPDAVEAVQVGRPELVDPAVSLLPGQVKGLLGTVPGVKKVANLRGRRGRGAELPEEYLRRGSGCHRHRDRAAEAWDYEELARLAAPELAAVRCLPHTGPEGGLRPGEVSLVVVPAGTEPMPLPTVALAERIESALRSRMPLTARVTVVAATYRPVTVAAHVLLVPGTPALVGRESIIGSLEAWLHPARSVPVRFGRPLFASEVVAFLESMAVVDRVASFSLTDVDGVAADPFVVDAGRGLVASSGNHALTVEEAL